MILHEIVSGPVKRLREGIARALARIGVSPDLLTVLGLLVNIGASALLALGHFRWAALTILFALANVTTLLSRTRRRAGTRERHDLPLRGVPGFHRGPLQ